MMYLMPPKITQIYEHIRTPGTECEIVLNIMKDDFFAYTVSGKGCQALIVQISSGSTDAPKAVKGKKK